MSAKREQFLAADSDLLTFVCIYGRFLILFRESAAKKE